MSVFDNAVDLTDIPKSEWKKYIGLGYRYVQYMTNHDREGQIVLFGYDTNGNPTTFICPHKSHIYYRVGYETNKKDMYGNYVAYKEFKSSYERNKYIERSSCLFIVESLKPEQEFLHELFDYDVLSSDFNKQTLRGHFIDIETEISEQFMKPKDAENRINMITIYDTLTEKFYTWSLSEAKIEFHDERNFIPNDKIEIEKEENKDNEDVSFINENGKWYKITYNRLKDYPKDKFELRCFHNHVDFLSKDCLELIDDKESPELKIAKDKDESDLLEDFISWIENNYPDYSYGWNIQAYDWPYIIRRIENVLGENEAKRISPLGKYRIEEVNHDNERANKQAEITVNISGLFIADGLVLYRDKFNIAPALDGGYGLSNVGEHEGLGRKIDYDGSLKDLYVNDYQKFYEYNVRDVDLVVRIEKKCKTIPLARQIAGSGLCNYNTIYSSISYLIGSVISFAKTQMNVLFQSYLNGENEKIPYEGAYVFTPIPGVYRGGIGTLDVNSLYPSTIRTLNLSPETYVGQLIENWDDDLPQYHFRPANSKDGKVKLITKEQILKLLDTKCIITKNNTLFLKHEVKKGVISEWCGVFYNLRKSTKKEMSNWDKKIYENKISGDDVIQAKTLIENLNSTQLGIKTMINSIYGILGTKHSPIYNPALAQTITRQGKFCNISVSKHIKEHFKKTYNITDDYVSCIGGDTDSFTKNTIICIKR